MILIGIGLILFAYMFSSGPVWIAKQYQRGGFTDAYIDIFGLYFSSKYPLTLGALISFIGFGMIILTFFPEKTKKEEKS